MKNDETAVTGITPPPVLWAQSKSSIFLTFEIECAKPEITIQKEIVMFRGVGVPEQKSYQIDIKLFADVNPAKSTITNKGRNIEVNLAKTDLNAAHWPFLTQDRTKPHWLKVDFNKWKDEDDSDGLDENLPMGDMFGRNMMEDDDMASLASANYGDDVYPDKFDEDFPPEFAEASTTNTS